MKRLRLMSEGLRSMTGDRTFEITENRNIARGIFRMVLAGDTSDITAPGQFVNIMLPNHYLRRPISVCDWKDGELTIIYKVVGAGTQDMSLMNAGTKLSLLTGLGNGYSLNTPVKNPVLVGGGVGIPPLYGLAVRLIAKGIRPGVIMGFNTQAECFYIDEFTALGLSVKVATIDGTYGTKGFVTDILGNSEYAYVCGPSAMLRAVHRIIPAGQFSFEARMGCGFGVCMGCSIRIRGGSKRVCCDGPVFSHEEIIFEDDE